MTTYPTQRICLRTDVTKAIPVCHFWSDFTMPATGVCQRKIDSEGYGINQRLTILTGKYSYVDRAAPTRQGYNSKDLGAHALIGLSQHKNDHQRSICLRTAVARAIPVCRLWADFAMTATTGVCQ